MHRRATFDDILAAMNRAAFNDSAWPEVAGLIDEACRTRGNILIYGEHTPVDDLVIHLHRHCKGGERAEELERLYCERYHPRDEHIPRLLALPDSRLALVRDLFTDEEKQGSPTYNEALPLGEMESSLGVHLAGPAGSRILWYVGDPTEGTGWSFDQTEMIERLLPHLRHYVRIRQVLADMHGLQTSVAGLLEHHATAVIQLDRRRRIVAASDRASAILNGQGALCARDGFLHAVAPPDDDRLQRLLTRALPRSGGPGAGGSIVVQSPVGSSHPVVHVTPVGRRDDGPPPLEAAAFVLVVDPHHRPPVDGALVEAALGLSPAESHIAVLLAQGRTVSEIAETTERSINTIRWHIRQIFEQLGINQLGQLLPLVRALARSPGNDP